MTEKPQRIMLTYRDPLSNAVQVRWFRSLYNLRKFIRSLCFDVPYKISSSSDNEWRGSYHFCSDIFTEYTDEDGLFEFEGCCFDEVHDDSNF